MFKNSIEKLINRLSGDSDNFTIETRMFNLTALLIGSLFSLGVVANFIIGLNFWLNISIVSCIAILFYTYYQSRFKDNYTYVLPIFIVVSYTMITLNWFLGAGSDGPSPIYFLLNLITLLIISPRRQYFFILAMQLITMSGLYYVDYNHSSWVIQYDDENARMIDMFLSTFFCLIFVFLIMALLKISYNRERTKVKLQQNEIYDQNKLILEQNENLEKMNHLKSKLFSIISHDMRSPLSTLHSAINILNETHLSESERLTIINGAKERLVYTQEMLDNLLSWANSQMNGMQTSMSKVNMKHLANSVLLHLKPQYESKFINAVSDIAEDVFVYADIEMIRLVIRNIFSNAAKFTSEDGNITIKAHTENDLVWITITDNGKGLTPIELEKINSKTSFSTPGTNNEKGTGLGLILCKDFLHVNNGELVVTSEMQKGTTFAFSLPLYTGQDENIDKQKDNIRALIRSKDRAKTFSDMY